LKILKRRYFSFIALTLVGVMLIITTGCGVRINGKEYELFKVSQKDKDNFFNGFDMESSSTQQISQAKQEGEQLVVSDSAGNIKINKSKTSQIEINADIKVRGSSEDSKKTIVDNMNMQLERKDKVINVVFKTKDGIDFWDWQKDNYKPYQITINFEISLPEGINFIDINTGAGNIDVNDISSKLSLDTGAGNIDIKDVVVLEDNLLSTGAGNIDFSGNVDNMSSFNVSTGAGNVKFEVPEDTKMSLDANTGIGNLSGSFIMKNDDEKFHFVGDINGGGPNVKLSTGVGNIRVDKD
jgi:hypothetical protein